MKLALRIAAITALTVALVALWLSGVDLAATGRALGAASPALVLLAGLIGLVHLPARALRWRTLLAAAGGEPPPFRELIVCITLGYLASFTVPGRMGEILRPALLSMRTRVPLGASVASVVFERMIDVLTLLALLSLFIALSPGMLGPELARSILLAAGVATTLMATGIALHLTLRERLDRVVSLLAGRLPRGLGAHFERLGLACLRGFDSLGHPGSWWRLPLLSLLTWSTPTLLFLIAIEAVGLDVPATAPLLMVGVSAVGIAIPTPAGVGGFHQVTTWSLREHLGAEPATAAATAVVAHATAVVPVVALGLYFCWREGLSWRSLRTVTQAATEEPDP